MISRTFESVACSLAIGSNKLRVCEWMRPIGQSATSKLACQSATLLWRDVHPNDDVLTGSPVALPKMDLIVLTNGQCDQVVDAVVIGVAIDVMNLVSVAAIVEWNWPVMGDPNLAMGIVIASLHRNIITRTA